MQLKVLFVGDLAVGKTSIFELYRTREVVKFPQHTLDPVIKSLTIVTMTPHTDVELHLYDTAGQERHKTLTKHFYRNADIAIFVFSIDDADSFRHIKDWRQEVLDHNEKDVAMILIGNKDDLNEQRLNLKPTSEQYAKTNGMKFIEMSAFRRDDCEKVDSVLREVVAEIVRQKNIAKTRPTQQEEVINLGVPQNQNGRWCRYC